MYIPWFKENMLCKLTRSLFLKDWARAKLIGFEDDFAYFFFFSLLGLNRVFLIKNFSS